ncbi:MAG: HD domain-containing protein [Actinobacteria bacterium]|nr:HD domain-containing protein [Actinomycetota bacterium]
MANLSDRDTPGRVISLLGDKYKFLRNLKQFTTVFSGVRSRDFRLGVSPIFVYLVLLGSAAAGLGAYLLGAREGPGDLWSMVALGVAAAYAERMKVGLLDIGNVAASIAFLPILLAAVVLGPTAAMVIGAMSMALEFRPPYMKWAVHTSSRSVTGAVTGLVSGALAPLPTPPLGRIALATAAATFTAQALDTCFTSITFKLRRHGGALDFVRRIWPVATSSMLLYTPIVAFLAAAYEELSPWTLPIFLVPALASHRLFCLYREQQVLADELSGANCQLERANLSFATALVATLEAKDRYTAGHSAAVAVYARDISKHLGLPEHQQRVVYLCGLVHDVGKIGLPPGLLEKPEPLALAERVSMEQHSSIGEYILSKVDDYAEIAAIVRHHHERWDGAGYPDGLAGDEIPLVSRIIAVADAYNAMTSDRPYREAMSSQVAMLHLAHGARAQFDESVIAAFESILTSATEQYRFGSGDQFALAVLDQEQSSLPAAVAA